MKKVLTGLCMFLALIFIAGCSFSFTTANVKDAVITTDVDEKGKPLDTVTEYTQDAAKFVVSAKLNNAPDNTQVKFVWNYLTGEQKITEIILDSGDKSGVYVYCDLTNETPWPAGDYNVEIYVDDRDKPDATAEFKVK